MRKIVKAALLFASAAAVTTAVAMPAAADPAQPVASTDITAVGSDTIEFLGNNFATLYNGQTPAPSRLFDSWDATGTSPITVKPGKSIPRPNGSSDGINALKNDTANPPVIDVARSSRKPQVGDSTTAGPLLFIPVAEDKVNYALSNAVPSHGVDGLTAAQLADIYKCNITDWHTLNPAAPAGSTIQPLIPQPGSGTRSFFEQQLGITDADLTHGCVTQVQEHDPAPIANNANAVAPFSAARFVYPTNLSSQIKLNTTGFVGYRPVYLVTRNDGSNNVPGYLQPLLGNGSGDGSGWICGTAAQNEVTAEGFVPLPDNTSSFCGLAEHI